jgi:hypothetical protein
MRAGALTNLLPQQGGLPKGDGADKIELNELIKLSNTKTQFGDFIV